MFVSDREKEVRERDRNGVGTWKAGQKEGSERASKQEVAKSKGEGDREKREKKGVQQKPT